MSPSSRGRGLKLSINGVSSFIEKVALFTRAWIEMSSTSEDFKGVLVALFTRAWIEIEVGYIFDKDGNVALFTRAWIEM